MAALTAADVTVTVSERQIIGKKKRVLASIAFGDGVDTYPSGGIPLPTFENWGLVRNFDDFIITDSSGEGLIYKYDKTNHKLLIYTQNIRTGSTAAAAAGNGCLAEDVNNAETALRVADTAIDTDYDMGAMREANTTFTPASTTIQGQVYGW